MCIAQEVRLILKDAETSLRKLIERGLREQSYADIAEVARMADGIARLHPGKITAPSVPRKTSDKETLTQKKSKVSAIPVPIAPTSGTVRGNYPFFGRDRDRLVKVGWSKKNKQEYEHRVPREAVTAFVSHLATNVRNGDLFEVERLLPMQDSSGDDIPAYQVYVTLGWLRTLGVVNKHGRDGYVLRDDSLEDGVLDRLWNTLPSR